MVGIGRLVVSTTPVAPTKRIRAKTPDPTCRTKSPDPKKLRKAEKKLAKLKKGSNDSGTESSSSKPPSLLKEQTTPAAKVRKQLSFELDTNQIHSIKAENPAGARTLKTKGGNAPAGMSLQDADNILKTMTPDPS